LIRGFKPHLVWILRPCYLLAKGAGAEEGAKVLRLLQLWVERSILTHQESEEMRVLITAAEIPGAGQAAPQQQHRPAMRPPVMRPPGPNLGGGFAQGGPAASSAMPGMMAGGMPGIRPVGIQPQMGMQQMMHQQRAPSPFQQMMHQQQVRQGVMPAGQLVMPSIPGIVGMQQFAARPMLQGYRPQMLKMTGGKQTPETVPVGVMATMLRQAMRRTREGRQQFVPYKPLESQFTPQMLPPVEVPTPRLMDRVQDFYEDLRDEERGSSSSRSGSRSRSRSRSRRSRSRSRSISSRSRSRSRSRDERPPGLVGVAVPPPMLS